MSKWGIFWIIFGIFIAVLLIQSIKTENRIQSERESFCEEREMVYEMNGFPATPKCLKIDEEKRIVKTYEIQKINGEYYLE